MGDIAELRGLVLCVTFLSTFILICGIMPPELIFGEQQNERNIYVPEHFESVDLEYISETKNTTVQDASPFTDTIGGWDIRVLSFKYPGVTVSDYLFLHHYAKRWIFSFNFHPMRWYDSSGIEISVSDRGDRLDIDALDGYEYGHKYSAECDHFKMSVYFGYNTTAFDSHVAAFRNGSLSILFALGFDERNTARNAWGLIGMVLFWQMPKIHPAINILISIPIWVTIGYLIYVLIAKIVPLSGGG